jgi:RNA polymerase sigma factor (sigma-70 family)
LTVRVSFGSRLVPAIQSSRACLRAFIRSRVPAGEDVEDILQEIIYRLLLADTPEHPVEHAAAWLFRAARNEIIDRARKKKEVPLPAYGEESDPALEEIAEVLFAGSATPEEEYLSGLFWRELWNALEELPAPQREAFEKTELQGCSFKQLAAESGLPVNTLISRKHKAVLHLRSRLRGLYGEIMER